MTKGKGNKKNGEGSAKANKGGLQAIEESSDVTNIVPPTQKEIEEFSLFNQLTKDAMKKIENDSKENKQDPEDKGPDGGEESGNEEDIDEDEAADHGEDSDDEEDLWNYEKNIRVLFQDYELYNSAVWQKTIDWVAFQHSLNRITIAASCIIWYSHPTEWLLFGRTKNNRMANSTRVSKHLIKFLPELTDSEWRALTDEERTKRAKWSTFSRVNGSMVQRVAFLSLQYLDIDEAVAWRRKHGGKPAEVNTAQFDESTTSGKIKASHIDHFKLTSDEWIDLNFGELFPNEDDALHSF
jgi:hypothetical protein